jgi:hypothetical protein
VRCYVSPDGKNTKPRQYRQQGRVIRFESPYFLPSNAPSCRRECADLAASVTHRVRGLPPRESTLVPITAHPILVPLSMRTASAERDCLFNGVTGLV